MAIPEQFIDELVARSEISDVVSSYVSLKKKGANLWGLCPFHSEKTPSFSVSQEKQIYHCFGCGKGGGVISFLMEIENLPFLLSDTVGFIRKLPTDLVDSFKSTLDEVREADLLLHIVDISHPDFEEQIEVVN